MAALFGLLAASWLGVLAFHGDGLQDRIHFLADRGVSPAKIWWTRHAPPLSLLAIAAALMVLVLPAPLRSACLSAEGLLCAVAVVLFPYTVSQAVGQVIHSATIAAIAAPVVTWVLAAYGVYMVSFLGVPAWLLAACAILPWLATCLLMRRWMDGRGGWGFWGGHAGFLAVGLVLPLVPVGWVLFSQPTMPGEVRREVTAESRRYGPMFAEPRELVLRFRRPESPDVPAANRRAEAEIVCEQLVHDLSVDPGAIRFERRVMAYLLGEAHLARMTLEQGGDAEESRRRYRRTLALVGTLVERLRMSWRLFDQDGADLIEIRLVRELTSSEARSWLGPELHARLVQAVGDDRGRNAARRRAVVMSWAEYRTRVHAPESRFGGYAWQGEPASALMRTNAFFRRRAADYLAWRMLQRLERSEPATSPERTKELARYWNVADSLYGLGPGGEYWRADDVGAFATQFDSYVRFAPGSQWHAGWERTARELLDKLDKSEAQR